MALPADAYAEVVFESGPVSAKTKPPTFQVAVYFYRGPELTTPLLPAPTDVRFELELPDREPVSLELKDESSNGQATGTRFVSEDRHESLDTIVGTIYATIGGESVTKPVITPR